MPLSKINKALCGLKEKGYTCDNMDNIILGTSSENNMDKTEEVRHKTALIATAKCRKYNKDEVKEFYNKNGWANTIKEFGISSKGTLSYIINN